MRAALWTGVLVVLPGIWFVLQGEALRWFSEGEPPRLLRPLVARLRPHAERLEQARRRLLRRPEPQPLPPVLITLELRRLAEEVRRVEASDAPHRAARMRAVLAAYDQVLLELCERLELPTDVGMPPLHSGERLTLEAEVVAAGHDL
ncbi:hypothetical protein GCM10023168_09320 [Fodinibacter luteus]|uniref:Uncharacterized protein n=1 Tax=Fodinibacter luteus TaxID=552064 RepID=A0ABP8K6G0_9MICO